MAATAQMIEKINTLNDQNMEMVVDFVDFLSLMQARGNSSQGNVFRRARTACQGYQMSDDDIESAVDDIKAERRAARS